MKNKKLCITLALTTLAISVGGFLGYEIKKANNKVKALNNKIDETDKLIENNDFENAQAIINELKEQCKCKKCLNKKIVALSNKLEDKKSTLLHSSCHEVEGTKVINKTNDTVSTNVNDSTGTINDTTNTDIEKVDNKVEPVHEVITNNEPKEIVTNKINAKNKFNKKYNKYTKHNNNH